MTNDFVSRKDFDDCRNELCYRCGAYKMLYLGACDDCRWNPEKWRKDDDN